MFKLFALISGGAVGTLARYYLSGFVNNLMGISFPFGTFIVNMSGSFLIGFLWGVSDYFPFSPNWRNFIFVGCLGGFTTFSTYMLESLNFIKDGNIKTGLLNLVLSTGIGLSLVIIGLIVSRAILPVTR